MPIPTEADQERARWALLQAQIDDPTHAFQRGGQFFALRFGRVGIFLAVPRQFIAKHLFFSFLRTLKQLDST